MGVDESTGREPLDPRCCQKCGCPLSRVVHVAKLTSKQEGVVIRKQRVCSHCKAIFWTREVEKA